MFSCNRSVQALGMRLAVVLTAASFGAGAVAGDQARAANKATQAIMSKVPGIAGPTSLATPAAAPARAASVKAAATSADSSEGDTPVEGKAGNPSAPAKVKPGVGPGQGDGVHSNGPAPR